MRSRSSIRPSRVVFMGLLASALAAFTAEPPDSGRHPVPRGHPRLLGSRGELEGLARTRAAEYERVVRVARELEADDSSKLMSVSLVAAIEGDRVLARQARDLATKYVDGPIRQGHVPFATDLALSALAYDLAHEAWSDADRERFNRYLNATVDANVDSETHVFHNGWYGYKHWGIGLAAYATYHENPRSPAILEALEAEFRTRAAPALELAGNGGGWAEGYYVHYWLYEWLFFCEVARRCEGVDYYALAPRFFENRALASVFETYPGIREYGSRRCVPMGDGGGRVFGGDRDKALSARRILVNHYRADARHQAIHAFNETTPRSSVGVYAYKDFLWRDRTVPQGQLAALPLSHFSPGAGHVYARSSWEEDATYFFFKCSDRYTAHQHLDAGHFVIYRQEELAGDGGHYDNFGSAHDVNYHLRTIAHSTLLVLDPDESWPGIRAGAVTGNDGGQHHHWPHHNGAVTDAAAWHRDRSLYDIADLLACEDRGDYLYVAGDATRAYSPRKLERFVRQIVYLRPNTFVVLDQVKSTRLEYRKTWLLQAMARPQPSGSHWVITNGKGRLFVQTLLPTDPEVHLAHGERLYAYGGRTYPPSRDTGSAPLCRIEISPTAPSQTDVFLHVLTAADAETQTVAPATMRASTAAIALEFGDVRISFSVDRLGGSVQIGDRVRAFPDRAAGGRQ